MPGWPFVAGLWAGAALTLFTVCAMFARYIAADMDRFTHWLENT